MTSGADQPAGVDPSDPAGPVGAVSAVLFDIDDTLVDFTGAAHTALLESVRLHLDPGLPDDDVLAAWVEVAEREYDRFTSGELSFDDMRVTRTRAFVDVLGARVTAGAPPGAPSAAKHPADVHERIEAHRTARIFDHYRLFDDVLPELDRLRAAGIAIGVVSNSDGDYQRRKLMTVGLAGFFDAEVFSGDLGVAKPDPAIFLAGVNALGAEPERTVYVGDRWDVDALGAAAAGLIPVWLDRTGGGRPDRSPGPAIACVSGLHELATVLTCPPVSPS